MRQTFVKRSSDAIHDEHLVRAVKFTVDRLRSRKAASTDALGNWEDWREAGRAIRAHTIKNLDYYLDKFATNLEANGGHIHFAADAAEAVEIFRRIAKSAGANLVAKSKSMVSEEMGLNYALADDGIKAVETDLGEWIVQLAHEHPSHIIIPAIHKTRSQIKALFEAESGNSETLSEETTLLCAYARRRLREVFATADIGMTGCNFAIAETGSLALFSNEGNARMVSTLPRTHIAVMGMERIIPSLSDLAVMARLLPRSATGQSITTYLSIVTGPARKPEIDGPESLHVIVLDNGRSDQIGEPEFEELLNCIRCGACLNVCPVYRQVGGNSYSPVYSGPIGAVLLPLLKGKWDEAAELAYASTLCGACSEACPVKIPLHDMLVHLRRRYVESGKSPLTEKAAMAVFVQGMGDPVMYKTASKLARLVPLPVIDAVSGPGPINGWTKYREMPKPSLRTLSQTWDVLERVESREDNA